MQTASLKLHDVRGLKGCDRKIFVHSGNFNNTTTLLSHKTQWESFTSPLLTLKLSLDGREVFHFKTESKMNTFIIFSTLIYVCSAFYLENSKNSDPTGCCPLSGTWINQHGSFMEITHSPDGTLSGKYYTAIEENMGASGGIQQIRGMAGVGKPTTFGMTVTFKDGKTTTAWSGQYHFCDGEQTLSTTWVMTSLSKTCKDDWKANRIGQDRFVRKSSRKSGSKWGNFARKLFNKVYRQHMARNTGKKF